MPSARATEADLLTGPLVVAGHFNLTGQALCDKEVERADHGTMSHLAIPINDNGEKRLLNTVKQMPAVAGSVTVWGD